MRRAIGLQSGKAENGLSRLLNLLMTSAKLAAVQKYCCFKRNSLPTEGVYFIVDVIGSGVISNKICGLNRERYNSQVVLSLGYKTLVIASALLEASTARS